MNMGNHRLVKIALFAAVAAIAFSAASQASADTFTLTTPIIQDPEGNCSRMAGPVNAGATENRSFYLTSVWIGGYASWDDQIGYSGSMNGRTTVDRAQPSSAGCRTEGWVGTGWIGQWFYFPISGENDYDDFGFNLLALQKRDVGSAGNKVWGEVQYGYTRNNCASGQFTLNNRCEWVAGTLTANGSHNISCIAPCDVNVNWSMAAGLDGYVTKNGSTWDSADSGSRGDNLVTFGNYKYAFLIKDGYGTYHEVSGADVTVTIPIDPLVCDPPSQTVQQGQTATFEASGGQDGAAYSWSAPGGSPSSGGNSRSFSTTYSSTGSKTVTVTRGGQSANCSVNVTPAPSGNISASPNPCTIPPGQGQCFSTISWSTGGSSDSKVYVSHNGGSESLFASGTSGSQAAPWIQGPGNTYDFRLYDYSGGSRQGGALATVQVTGNVSAVATYPLSVNSSGASSVSISGNPAAYSGTTNYSRSGITSGTSITLTAPFNAGSSNFSSWSGCDSVSRPNPSASGETVCNLTMNSSRTVTANYEAIPIISPPAPGAMGLNANPSSGQTPLNNVDLVTNINDGSGSYLYWFYYWCHEPVQQSIPPVVGTDRNYGPQASPNHTASDLCNYDTAGSYIPRVASLRFDLSTFSTLWRQTSSSVTVSSPPIPAAPNLNSPRTSCSGITSQIDLSWNSVSGATGYKIWRNGVMYRDIGNVVSWSDNTISAGTVYSYQVRAYNTFGDSDLSNSHSQQAYWCIGDITVQATLNGSPWTGAVDYYLWGPAILFDSSVSTTRNNLSSGIWQLDYDSGGPVASSLSSITLVNPQTLPGNVASKPTLTYTMNFNSNPPSAPCTDSCSGGGQGAGGPGGGGAGGQTGVCSGTVCNESGGLAVGTGVSVSCEEIFFAWQDNGNNEAGFYIWRSPSIGGITMSYDSRTYSRIATVAPNTERYVDNPPPEDSYYYAVTAYNAGGESAPSGAGPVFNTSCTANLSLSSKIVSQLNGSPYTGQTIRNNDILKFQVIIRNDGNTQAFDLYVQDTISGNLVYQPGTAKLKKGAGADNSITASQSNQTITFDIPQNLGDKAADGLNWLLTFDARVNTSSEQPVDFIQNQATIFYAVSDGGVQSGTAGVSTGLVIVRTGQAQVPEFREIEP